MPNIMEYLKKMKGESDKVNSALKPAPSAPQQNMIPEFMSLRKTDPMSLPSQPSQDQLDMGWYDPQLAASIDAENKEKKRLAGKIGSGAVAQYIRPRAVE